MRESALDIRLTVASEIMASVTAAVAAAVSSSPLCKAGRLVWENNMDNRCSYDSADLVRWLRKSLFVLFILYDWDSLSSILGM